MSKLEQGMQTHITLTTLPQSPPDNETPKPFPNTNNKSFADIDNAIDFQPYEANTRIFIAVSFLIFGIIIFIISLVIMDNSTTTDWFKWIQGNTSENGIISLIFHTILQPIGFIIIIASLNNILTHKHTIEINIFFTLLFFASSIIILFSWNADIYFTFDINTLPIFPRCLIGFWTFILLITVSILCFINSIRITYHINNWSFNCCTSINWTLVFSIGFILIYLPLCFIFSTFTGHSWHSYPGNYFPRDFVKWVNTKSTDEWTLNYLIGKYDLSDNTYAVENGLTGDVYMKIFPDVLMYYCWLELICICALISHFIPSIRKTLKRRIFLFQTDKLKKMGYSDFKWYPTIGDLLFVLSLIIFLIIWFYYWFVIHLYREIPNNASREVIARTFGMTANLFACLLILPITRNSSFNNILGVSYEGIIVYHFYCGYIWFICSFLHVVLFINYFDVNGKDFTYFGFSVPIDVKKMLPFTMDTPQVYIPNNYTVPQMWYIYLFIIIPIFGIFTMPKIRRKRFDRWYYIHVSGAWITISVMCWHAASFIYFLLPIAGMYFFDRCMRFMNGLRIVKIKEINVVENDIIKLSVNINNDITNKNGINEIFGGYYFVKIANISTFEWHPFSVFKYNVMNDRETNLEFYIRASGDFTKQLYLYAQNSNDNIKTDMEICLDGPYGCGFNFMNDYQHIFIIAGGIGITPCHSLLNGLINNDMYNNTLTFVWIVKNYKELYLCKKTFESIQDNKQCNVLLYITRSDNLESNKNTFDKLENDFVGCEINKKRPMIKDVILSEYQKVGIDTNDNNNSKQLLYCCGPVSLVQTCRQVSYGFHMDFKDESFEF
eukprot:439048_1